MPWNKLRRAVLLTLPLWLGLLASCAPVTSDPCAGWGQVQLAGASVDWLSVHDPQALTAMIGNQMYGRKLCGW